MNKKKLIEAGIGFIILIAASIFIYYGATQENENRVLIIYSYKLDDIKYYTFDRETAIGKNMETRSFKCRNENCKGIYIIDSYAYIADDDNTYLYDISSTRTLLENVSVKDIMVTTDTSKDKYGLIITNTDDYMGYYNLNDNKLTIPFLYKWIGTDKEDYLEIATQNNILVVKTECNEGSSCTGLINIRTGKFIIELSATKNIRFSDSNTLIVTESDNNITYDKLYNFKGNELLDNKEFKYIYTVSTWKNIVFLNDNGSLYAYEKDGTMITNIAVIKDDYEFIEVFPKEGVFEIKFISKNTQEEIKFYYNPDTKEVQDRMFS